MKNMYFSLFLSMFFKFFSTHCKIVHYVEFRPQFIFFFSIFIFHEIFDFRPKFLFLTVKIMIPGENFDFLARNFRFSKFLTTNFLF